MNRIKPFIFCVLVQVCLVSWSSFAGENDRAIIVYQPYKNLVDQSYKNFLEEKMKSAEARYLENFKASLGIGDQSLETLLAIPEIKEARLRYYREAESHNNEIFRNIGFSKDTIGNIGALLERPKDFVNYSRTCKAFHGYYSERICQNPLIPLLISPEAVIQLSEAQTRLFAPQFAEWGPAYLIKDPENRVRPFILSAEMPGRYTHYEAAGAIDERAKTWLEGQGLPLEGKCHGRGTLMTKDQAKALARALGRKRPGGFNPGLIQGQLSAGVWSSSVHPDMPLNAFFLSGSFGGVYDFHRVGVSSVQCVQPVAAW